VNGLGIEFHPENWRFKAYTCAGGQAATKIRLSRLIEKTVVFLIYALHPIISPDFTGTIGLQFR
jgi:hypothetical protein